MWLTQREVTSSDHSMIGDRGEFFNPQSPAADRRFLSPQGVGAHGFPGPGTSRTGRDVAANQRTVIGGRAADRPCGSRGIRPGCTLQPGPFTAATSPRTLEAESGRAADLFLGWQSNASFIRQTSW
jgi:hypothetical protein